MRALTTSRPQQIAVELRTLADALDEAVTALDGTKLKTIAMMCAWAKARRTYCRESGGPLI